MTYNPPGHCLGVTCIDTPGIGSWSNNTLWEMVWKVIMNQRKTKFAQYLHYRGSLPIEPHCLSLTPVYLQMHHHQAPVPIPRIQNKECWLHVPTLTHIVKISSILLSCKNRNDVLGPESLRNLTNWRIVILQCILVIYFPSRWWLF